MVSQELINEVDLNIKLIQDAPNTYASDDDIIYEIEMATRRLLDLTRLIFAEGEVEYGLEVSRKGKDYARQILEYVSGMKMRELGDYMIAHPEMDRSQYDLYWDFVLEESFWDFESFMFYMEMNRPFAKKFYEPRMYTKSGKPSLVLVAKELQNLEYRKYKFLGVSLPSRTGKSTICIFYLCWKALRHPTSHSAMGGHAGTLVKGFYKELLNFMTSNEYTYPLIYDRFHPAEILIQDKSAEDFTITLKEPSRFGTITCRGIDATWTGAVDVSWDGVLYVDDLVRDRQHSLSPTRMEETFQEYLNKMCDRKSGFDPMDGTFAGATELMVGTLWNVLDPLERIRHMYENNPLYKFLRIPALDENDESNFDYEYNGFTTEYYKEMRSRLDNAEWQSKYQQSPYVREGLLFPTEELVFFDGLIEVANIKRVYSVTDTAVGGGDNVSAPICYEMNDGRKLICKWIYDKRTVKYTVPRVINAYKEHSVSDARVERNGVGALWVDNAQKYIKEKNIVGIKLTPVSAPNRMSKEDKIKGYSDAIKQNYQFIAPNVVKPEDIPDGFLFFERDADYNNAMADMAMYTSEGKNTTDDACDSMAQLAIMDEKKKNGEIRPIHIPDGFGF